MSLSAREGPVELTGVGASSWSGRSLSIEGWGDLTSLSPLALCEGLLTLLPPTGLQSNQINFIILEDVSFLVQFYGFFYLSCTYYCFKCLINNLSALINHWIIANYSVLPFSISSSFSSFSFLFLLLFLYLNNSWGVSLGRFGGDAHPKSLTICVSHQNSLICDVYSCL